MIAYINEHSTNPAYNLALEEFFLLNDEIDDDMLLFWRNEPTIVIGKHQNAYVEVNEQYVKDNDIHVVRRLSGGGAVYHDLGNLNFTIIRQNAKRYQNDFSFFTEPVVACLQDLGLPAEFSGRNDLLLDGHKISGNSQYSHKDRLLHHGTLLFDSDLSIFPKALTPKPEKYKTRGVKSVESRVTNIREYDKDLTIDKFTDALIKHFFRDAEPNIYELTEADKKEIEKLRDEKYGTWDWVYGKSPKMDKQKGDRFDAAGTIELHTTITNGKIEDIMLTGDFFEKQPLEPLYKSLIGTNYTEEDVLEALKDTPVSEYIHNWTNEGFMTLLF